MWLSIQRNVKRIMPVRQVGDSSASIFQSYLGIGAHGISKLCRAIFDVCMSADSQYTKKRIDWLYCGPNLLVLVCWIIMDYSPFQKWIEHRHQTYNMATPARPKVACEFLWSTKRGPRNNGSNMYHYFHLDHSASIMYNVYIRLTYWLYQVISIFYCIYVWWVTILIIWMQDQLHVWFTGTFRI